MINYNIIFIFVTLHIYIFLSNIDDIQIIGMSATIGNMQEIGEFLNAHVYTRNFRPIQLTETIKINNEIFVISKNIDGSLKIQLNRKLKFDVSFKGLLENSFLMIIILENVCIENNCLCLGLQ